MGNRIRLVRFEEGEHVGRDVTDRPLYQGNYGQVIQFDGLTLPDSFEVHMTDESVGEAVQVIGGNNEVEIPNVLMERSGTLTVYIFLHDTEDDGTTCYTAWLMRNPKVTPDEQEIPEPEQDVISQTIGALNAAVAKAEEILDSIDLSDYALKEDTVLTTTLSRGRKSGEEVGDGSFAFGFKVTASGQHSHAEGSSTTASGGSAHAEGGMTHATQTCAHAEGNQTFARGVSAHSEGMATYADGNTAHAEGMGTKAVGNNSHAEGMATIANGKSQHVVGEYNAVDVNPATPTARSPYVEIVGNGTANNKRSNARTLDWSGNAWFAGKVSTGTEMTPGGVTADNDLTTKKYVDSADAILKAIIDYNIMMGILEDPEESGEKFELVKGYYDAGLWEKKAVKNAVLREWITADEYAVITGEGFEA